MNDYKQSLRRIEEEDDRQVVIDCSRLLLTSHWGRVDRHVLLWCGSCQEQVADVNVYRVPVVLKDIYEQRNRVVHLSECFWCLVIFLRLQISGRTKQTEISALDRLAAKTNMSRTLCWMVKSQIIL